MAPHRFLVTGALGAVGVWTMRSLLERGHAVVALDVGGDGHRLPLALDAEQRAAVVHVQGDITDPGILERVLDEHAITNVIHLAALQVPFVREDPLAGANVNVTGTVNVLEAVRRRGDGMAAVVYASSIAALPVDHRRHPALGARVNVVGTVNVLEAVRGSARAMGPVVYASSIAAYGANGTLGAGDHPGTLYGVYKRANESTAVRYYEDYGVSSIGLRPHTVYGPARDQGLTSAPTTAMLAAAAGRPYRIPFGGSAQLQYTPDIGEAFARAALLEYDGASIHDVGGPVVAMAELASMIDGGGLITVADDPLPFPSGVDGSSFEALVGDRVIRPVEDGVADAMRRFERLLAEGLVDAPV
jgi:UDP-glucuronate 4-epimerase